MTVNTATASASYNGNGATTAFSVPFYFLVDTDVKITKSTAAGVITTLVLNSDYTLAGTGNTAGGTATLTVAPAAGETIFIERNVDAVQQTAYPDNGPFPAASHEKALDRLTMLVQQLLTSVGFKLGKNALGTSYDAGGNRISNLANGVDVTDATTLQQVKSLVVDGAVPLLSGTGPGEGAALVGYQLSGITGSVARDLNDRALDRKSLFDFFTSAQKSDVRSNTGSIDVGATITTILANLSAAGGGIIEAPPGTYLTTTTIVVPSNVHLIGHGPSSVIKASSVANQVFYIGNATTPYATGIRVSGFNITGSAGTGVEVNNCILASISDITLNGLTCTEGFYFHNTFGCGFFNLWTNGATISDNAFVCGAAYNANTAVNWYTSNYCACNIRIDASYNGGNGFASGSSFNGLTVQGGTIGLWVRQYRGATISGMYEENAVTPIVLGDLTASIYPQGVTIEGVSLSGPNSSNPNYASRYSFIDFQFAKGCEIHGVSFGSSTMETTIAPVSFSGGGGSGAVAVAILTAAGAVHDIVTLYGGSGYTSAPTVSIGGTGTGATATCVLSGSQVGAITVTAGGSGYTPTSCPLAVTYSRPYQCSIHYPSWNAGNGLNSVMYAYVKRSSGAATNCGVNIFGDASRLYNGAATPADFRKTQGYSYQHVITELSPTGAWSNTPFVPIQYP